jgi:hypothetical protein
LVWFDYCSSSLISINSAHVASASLCTYCHRTRSQNRKQKIDADIYSPHYKYKYIHANYKQSIIKQISKLTQKVHREALATCALAVGVQKSKHRNVWINIIWICINFALHDMFYCAVFNLCNLSCMSVWKALESLCWTHYKYKYIHANYKQSIIKQISKLTQNTYKIVLLITKIFHLFSYRFQKLYSADLERYKRSLVWKN